MHPNFAKADRLSGEVIGAAILVHRIMGPGLLESIYERCLLRELELRGVPVLNQEEVVIDYKGTVFKETLKFDLLVDGCLLVELRNRPEITSRLRICVPLAMPVSPCLGGHWQSQWHPESQRS